MNNWSGELQGIIVTFCFNQFPSGVGESALKGKKAAAKKGRDGESGCWWKWTLCLQSLHWHLLQLKTSFIQRQKWLFSAPSSEDFCQSDTDAILSIPTQYIHMLLTWFLFLWCARLWKVSQPLWCVSAKPLVSCVPVVLRMSERVIGLPVVLCGFKKLLSSLENRQQPVKTWERWRCQMLLCPLQHWSVNKSHHYQTTKQFLNVENLDQTNNFLHSFINTFSCKVFCVPPLVPHLQILLTPPSTDLPTFDLCFSFYSIERN